MCLGTIVFGQSAQASSIILPALKVNRWVGSASVDPCSTAAFKVRVTCQSDLASIWLLAWKRSGRIHCSLVLL